MRRQNNAFGRPWRVNPQNAVDRIRFGIASCRDRKDRTMQRPCLRKALELDPQMAGAAYDLAVLVGQPRSGKSRGLCATAAESHPEEPKYAFSHAYYLLLQKKQKEAIPILEALLKLHPAYVDAVIMLGDLYLKLDRAEDAKALYERALARSDLPSDYREPLNRRLNMLR